MAEAARQEQARKAKEHLPPQHVYTNDDLKRAQILTPADESKVEARLKHSEKPAAVQPAKSLNAASPSGKESLGEIARRYRQEKAARETEDVLKRLTPSGFPMKLRSNSLATPKPLAAPPVNSPRMIAPRMFRPLMVAPSRVGAISPGTSRSMMAPGRAAANPMVPRTRQLPSGVASGARISPFEPRPLYTRRSPELVPSPPLERADVGHLVRVTVKQGDTYWKFAREYLGSGTRWQELLPINPGATDPRALEVGSVVFVPGRIPIVVRGQVLSSTGIIVVRKGDTLWSIASSHLGSGSAWTCLAESNPQIANPDLIIPGQRLNLPGSCGNSP